MSVSKDEENRVYTIKLDVGIQGDGGDSAGDTPQDKQDNENGQIAAGAGQTKSKNVSKGAWALNLAKQQGTKLASDLIEYRRHNGRLHCASEYTGDARNRVNVWRYCRGNGGGRSSRVCRFCNRRGSFRGNRRSELSEANLYAK